MELNYIKVTMTSETDTAAQVWLNQVYGRIITKRMDNSDKALKFLRILCIIFYICLVVREYFPE